MARCGLLIKGGPCACCRDNRCKNGPIESRLLEKALFQNGSDCVEAISRKQSIADKMIT